MLKAVCFGFNGVIVKDLAVHRRLIEQLVLEENMRPDPDEYTQICLGRSDRACLKDLFMKRGRVMSNQMLDKLVQKKTARYQAELSELKKLPLYPGLDDLIFKIRAAKLRMAIVTGATFPEVETILAQANLAEHFSIIVSGNDLTPEASKPEPDSYLLAVQKLNTAFPTLNLKPENCLAIEDSFIGIKAAKQAGMQVVGVAHTYPFRMMQRRANWAVDYLFEIDLDWIRRVYDPALALPISEE
ncbi:MAG: HAD family phosphatase [Cyanobacteria bacterium J06642_9]